MNQALRDRPDLQQQAERIRASEEAIKQARNAYLPNIAFAGQLGRLRGYGEQLGNPGAYSTGNVWDARLSLDWTIFDGGRRGSELARTHAEQRAAQAEYDSLRDEAENQVWVAYSNVKTAQAQQQAATALLSAATESYNAATDAYSNGVRTLLDVLNAQRVLALARSEDVAARTSLYRQVATLAFRTGDLLRTRGRQPAP
jgi:outer membrane protein TolC